MEIKKLKIKKTTRLYDLKRLILFEWNVVREKDFGSYSEVEVERDDTTSYYNDLLQLEKSFNNISKIPMWLMAGLAVIIVALLTAFLVLMISSGENFDKNFYFLTLVLPSICLTFILSILGIIKTKKTVDYLNRYDEKYKEIETKITELKQNETK